MSITLPALEAQLRANIVNSSLKLNAATTSIPSLNDILKNISSDSSLTINSVNINNTGSQLIVTGTAAFLNINILSITATFVIVNNNAQMSLTASIIGPWSFAQSFPGLPNYSDSANALADQISSSSFIYTLQFQLPNFILSTYQYPYQNSDLQIGTGWNFVANLPLDGPLNFFRLLGGSGPLNLLGNFDFSRSVTQFNLSANLPFNIGIGPISLKSLGLTIYNRYSTIISDYISGMQLSCRTKLGSSSEMLLTSDIMLNSARQVFLQGTFTNLTLPGLADLADLVGGDDLAALLPSPIQNLTKFTITEFNLNCSLTNRAIYDFRISLNNDFNWVIAEDVLTIKSFAMDWYITNPLDSKQRTIQASVLGKIDVGGGSIIIAASYPEFIIQGGLDEGDVIDVSAMLEHFVPGIPKPDNPLTITELQFTALPLEHSYSFATTIANVWSVSLDFGTISIDSLEFYIDYTNAQIAFNFLGFITLFGATFIISADRPTTGNWTFGAQLLENETINLIALVNGTVAVVTGSHIDLSDVYGLQSLVITQLDFSVTTGSAKEYSFQGALIWNTGISLTDGDAIVIDAMVDINKQSNAPLSGTVGGTLKTSIPYFENMVLSVYYSFDQANGQNKKELTFKLQLNNFILNAKYTAGSGDTIIVFDTAGYSLSFGDLITYLVSLVDSSVDDFQLDPPWDELNSIMLSNFELIINTTKKTVTLAYRTTITLGFIKIDSLQLVYHQNSGTSRSVNIAFTGSFLGITYGDNNPISWDALNQDPPAVPGRGKTVFDLQYLGLGQHISFASVSQFENIGQAMQALRETVIPPADKKENPLAKNNQLQFNANSGWLIGAQFSLLDTIDLSLIFNDPLIYGLRISMYGEKAKIFAGLKFEILYRKITNSIGVYHIELVIPDAMRRFELGAVTLTLPIVVLDIYTNGDFKIDLGFPWNGDFTRSFGVEALPFIGAGGFYFNKLSADTATSVPVITNGAFSPIIEFGIGLRIGLGKSFNKGPLKAELSIVVQGIVEGVIAWFHPNNPAVSSDQYYRLQGSISIVGRLYGEVDFEIISVSVEVIARATVQMIVEVYKPILINLSVEVSVRASIKILFVRIHFSFSLTISQSFSLGSTRPTPWILSADQSRVRLPHNTGSSRAALRSVQPMLAQPMLAAPIMAKRAVASVNMVSATIDQLDIFFQPSLTISVAGIKGIALMFIENGIPLDATDHSGYAQPDAAMTDFDRLAIKVLVWAINRYVTVTNNIVTIDLLQQAYDQFVNDYQTTKTKFNLPALTDFFVNNFIFNITDCITQTSCTIFPIIPQLAIQFGNAVPINIGATYAEANSICLDYFALMIRSGLNNCIDYLSDNNLANSDLNNLMTALKDEGDFNHLAGMVSRFMLHGLRLSDNNNPTGTPLYQATGQQFAVTNDMANTNYSITFSNPAQLGWIQFTDYVDAQTTKSNAATLQYFFTNSLITLYQELYSLQNPLTQLPNQKPDLLPYYIELPHRFTVQHIVGDVNIANNQTLSIMNFPTGLITFLAMQSSGIALSLNYGIPTKTDLDVRPLNNYCWATRITLNIRRIQESDTTLNNTYQIIGTSEADKDLLAQVWQHINNSTPHIYLLYSDQGDEITTEQLSDDSLILKTNLATHNANNQVTDQLYNATLSTPANFIKLLWEAANIGNGYLLNISLANGLPDKLFSDGENGKLILLVANSLPNGQMPVTVNNFHNCLLLGEIVNLDQGILFAQSNDLVKTQNVATGNLGIKFTRPRIIVDANNSSAVDELENLYQMLAYQLLDTPTLKSSQNELPIGPADDDPNTTADDNLWIYQRTLPLYTYAKSNNLIDEANLPLASGNPYAGIAQNAFAKFQFYWQDIYGNQIGQDSAMQINPQWRYFDRIIGINQWPSVLERYSVAPLNNQTATFNIELSLDQTPYIPLASSVFNQVKDTITAARNQYQQIYYQILQSDLNFSFQTSIIPGIQYQFTNSDKQLLIDFVKSTYRYLTTVAQFQPLTYNIAANDTLQSISDKYFITPDQLANANKDVSNIFAVNTLLTAQMQQTVLTSDTLAIIVDRLIDKSGTPAEIDQRRQVRLLDLANINANNSNLLKTQMVISLSGNSYQTNNGDTLMIVATQLKSSLQALITSIKDRSDLLVIDSLINVIVDYCVVANDSLSSITETLRVKDAQQHLLLASVYQSNLTIALRGNQSINLLIPGRVSLNLAHTTTINLAPTKSLNDLAASLTGTNISSEDIITANQSLIGLLKAGSKILTSNLNATTLSQNSLLSSDDWQLIINANLTVRNNETLSSIINRIVDLLNQAKRSNAQFSLSDLTLAISSNSSLFVDNAILVKPAIDIQKAININITGSNGQLNYPQDLIFAVTVQIDMMRSDNLLDSNWKTLVPEIGKISSYLTPKVPLPTIDNTDNSAAPSNALQQFATNFEAAFPGLHLALGQNSATANSNDNDNSNNRSLWAVHLGSTGFNYNINEAQPLFFAPAPLSNSLFTGNVDINSYGSDNGISSTTTTRKFSGVDINLSGRELLVAIENILDAANIVPAFKLSSASINAIISNKATLAKAIYHQVSNILVTADNSIGDRRNVAADSLYQKLLANLVEGFDIETIIQYRVDVNLPNNINYANGTAPRLFGQPVVMAVLDRDGNPLNSKIDFTLSTASIALTNGGSYLTFLFDTPSPEKLEDITLKLLYRINSIEYNISNLSGIADYQSSDWLTFINPVDRGDATVVLSPGNPNYIGDVDIPIPLRTFPISPSLLLQNANNDPDSLINLADIRQWEYIYTYEHLDIAQDTIKSEVLFNSTGSAASTQSNATTSTTKDQLTAKLINFSSVYQDIIVDLNLLQDDQLWNDNNLQTRATKALAALAQVVSDASVAWSAWQATPATQDNGDIVSAGSYYEITEVGNNGHKDVTILIDKDNKISSIPSIAVPGYQQDSSDNSIKDGNKEVIYHFSKSTNGTTQPVANLGNSGIPDRTITLPDLDIIGQQNAWASVWLTRNEELLVGQKTNSAFIFSTPKIRFNNSLTPLLVNSKQWDISLINGNGQSQKRSLAMHLETLFKQLLPAKSSAPYALKIGCNYAFALVSGNDENNQLISNLPVLLGNRLSVKAGDDMLAVTSAFRTNLVNDILSWQAKYRPSTSNASYIFNICIFSDPDVNNIVDRINLPLLKIGNLYLKLINII